MIYASICVALSSALEKLKEIVKENEEKGKRTVIFCEDRLSLAAERTVCAAVGGTFTSSVYTFARFLTAEAGKADNVLSSQGSAMAIRKIIEDNKHRLTLFKKLSAQTAAQAVYDTIALLYSSRVSAEDAAKAAEGGGILGGKLHDLAIIYAEYEKYLADSGKQDRNGYLRKLSGVIADSPAIKGSAVVFLGFQAFTCTSAECVRAAFGAAESVYGLFIGGGEDLYVNEARTVFCGIAEEFGGAEVAEEGYETVKEAEVLRKSLFNPESFYNAPVKTDAVSIFEAADGEEELEFIAASIKKHVLDEGERYAKISVMLPDLNEGERALARVFSRFKIPYYADRQLSLSEHPLTAFIISYLSCAAAGCTFQDVDACVSSAFFPADNADKDVFRNYLLRLANYRGGVKREPKEEILTNLGFDGKAVERVREKFLTGLSHLTAKGGNHGICGGIRALLSDFEVENKLKDVAKEYRDERPAAAAFSARVFDGVINVLSEAESVVSENMPLGEFIKILKSGFSAMKISLIPPKADAVFVGDLSATANTGSNVVFAARLTGDVPGAGNDASLLTDREISALEGVNLNISPKIRQVYARRREICGLNICAFRKRLYLTYPARLNGEESGASEIIAYARAVFITPAEKPLAPVDMKRLERSGRAVPFYCSEKLPAIRHLRKYGNSYEAASVYSVLTSHGFGAEASAALKRPVKKALTCGKKLYLNGKNSLSPTMLEGYFACPYLGFMRQGLKVQEREEGAVRAVDTGNLIHSVLQDLAGEVNSSLDTEEFSARARKLAEDKLSKPPFSALCDSDSGKFVAGELIKEAVKVSEGMYEQIKNSSFRVAAAEWGCVIPLSDVNVYGRVDRVDEYGDMVRIIDYKTGNVDGAAAKYYMGTKLQLPLYLLAASRGKRAAGAYYYHAALEYSDKRDGVFRLCGFMDGSEEVVSASDNGVQKGNKSEYVDAYLSGRSVESAMPPEDFVNFLEYSKLVADKGVKEMLEGNISPSPAEGVCKFCKAGGSCGMALGKNGEERRSKAVKCSRIAEIAKAEKEGGNDTDR